jgi:hypothetical protein
METVDVSGGLQWRQVLGEGHLMASSMIRKTVTNASIGTMDHAAKSASICSAGGFKDIFFNIRIT